MPRGGKSNAKPHDDAERAEVAQRRTEAIKLRRAGASYQEIADKLMYPGGRGQVYHDIERALKASLAEQYEQVALYVEEELARLDRLQLGLWQEASNGDPVAVNAIIKIMQHRAKLRPGMLAPLVIHHEEITRDDVDRRILELTEQLGDRARADGVAGAAPPDGHPG